MLSYRRRSSTTIANDINVTDINRSLLTYCNWSYASQYHIDESTLVNILTSFIESHNISMQQI